jgi:hypothetical protein
MSCQDDLLEVVFALRATGSFASLLHGGQQQGNENRDDGDHNQQFDQGKATGPAIQGTHENDSTGRLGKIGEKSRRRRLRYSAGDLRKKKVSRD